MSKTKKIGLIVGVCFSLFLSIFALDVFSEGYVWWELLIALFMHLIPSIVVLAIMYLAWKNGLIGGLLVLALSLFSIYFFKTYEDPISYFTISGIPFVVSILLMFDWFKSRKLIWVVIALSVLFVAGGVVVGIYETKDMDSLVNLVVV